MYTPVPTLNTGIQSGSQPSSRGIDFNNEDQLYQLAKMQGGAIAENAESLAHPNTGILSTIGKGFKNLFHGFVETISIPSQIVAGTLSQEKTIGEAIDQNLAIHQVVFGDTPIFGQEGSQTLMQKVGGFIVRAPVEILGDPLTWVTGGLGNLSKVNTLSKAGKLANEAVSAEVLASGLKGVEAETFIAKRLKELEEVSDTPFMESVTLNREGQDVLTKYANHVQQGTYNTFVKEEAVKLVNASADEFGKTTKGIEQAILEVKESIKAKNFDVELLNKTIDAPLDMERAKQVVGNMLSRKPALLETLVDKGGIKFLGRTLLEGQRIDSAIKMIPGFKIADNLTSAIKKSVFGIKPTTKEFNKLERAAIDKSKVMKNEAIKGVTKVIINNELTAIEADLVTAAIEVGKMPIDPKLRDIYLTTLGIDTKGVLVNGDNVAQAVRKLQGINKMNLREAWDAGIAVSKQDNYMFHLTALKDLKSNRSSLSPVVNLKSAKFAEIQKYESLRNIDDYTKENPIGRAEAVLGGLERYDPNLVIKTLKQTLTKLEDKFDIKLQDLEEQTIDLQNGIQEGFAKFAEGKFVELIQKSVPGAKGDYIEAAARFFKENIPDVDFRALKDSRLKALKEADTTVGFLRTSSPEKIKAAIAKQFEAASKAKQELPGFTKDVNKAIEDELTIDKYLLHCDIEVIEKGIVSTADNGIIDAEAQAFIKQLKTARKEYDAKLVASNIDEKIMAEYMDKMVIEFNQNPVGVKHLINSLLGKESKMHKILDELSDKKFALAKQLDETGELAFMDNALYRAKSGEIFRASRPTIVEAKAAGFNLEQNALAIMIHASVNTVKATVSKEFIYSVATKFGRLESEAPDGWREVSVSGLKEAPKNLSNWLTGKNGEKIVFHPEIAERIEKFTKTVINDEDVNEVLKHYDKLTNAFKASVTSVFPAFHGRNAISNVMNSFLDIGYAALNPLRHITSAQISRASYRINSLKNDLAKGKDVNKELMRELNRVAFTDKRGYEWTQGQLEDLLRKNNVAFGNQFVDHIDIVKHTSQDAVDSYREKLWSIDEKGNKISKTTKVLKAPARGISNTFEAGQQVGQMIEDHSRLIHFLENLDRTGDVGLAAERTKMFLFDYGNLSSFERTFLKRIIPFYTWISKNVELQAKTLIATPGRLAQQVHVFNTMSYVMTDGNGLTDEEYNNLPQYMKNQFSIVTSRNGDKLHMLNNLGGPLEAAFQAIQPKNILSSVNPLFTLPAQLTTGYDIFREGMMSDTNNAQLIKDAPKWVKEASGFVHYQYQTKDGVWHDKYSALNPKVFFLLMNQPFGSRIFAQALHTQSELKAGTANSIEENLKNATGISSRDMDFGDLSAQAQKKRVQALQQLLEEGGVKSKLIKYYDSKNTRQAE